MAGKPSEPGGHVPDGLDRVAIDALIAEVFDGLGDCPGPTSALLDGSAAERRRRRMTRRALAVVARSLPAGRRVVSVEAGVA
ncbi:hypothetical protein [Pseudonocardia acaciae]|uniref:hypothetical protein n=1 Tax=Pseudonocardia acaciae TaxID=551276 RepID=UPI00048C6C60|nr:hypothetical protein [Pseudonocardia acaciae]